MGRPGVLAFGSPTQRVRLAVLLVARVAGRPGPSLIIDHHPSCRASARHVLEDAGFVVIGEAQDGASGLAAATEMRPAVVLLDVQLPHVEAIEVRE
ncbi:MAG: response regulator, partial [Solirubrobacteraceae bacterium]